MSELKFTEVESTNVHSHAYDEAQLAIVIRYKNGGQYAYAKAGTDLYEDLKNAASIGSFVHSQLKPLKCTKLEDWK